MANQITQQFTVKQLVKADVVKEKFNNVLGNRAPQFMTSLINVVNDNYQLQEVDANSVVASALVAAALDLPINQNLGYMYIVPYGKTATPQIGYRGYIQLAQRSGQYRKITALPVYEDEYKGWNPLTEELKYEHHDKYRKGEKPVGYFGSFELLNGFEKNVYWTWQQIDDHRKEFSQSGGKNSDQPKGVWAKHYDAMALKTVLRNLLTKWGPMTVDIQTASMADSGDYDHLEDSPRDVTPEQGQAEQTQELLDGFYKSQGKGEEGGRENGNDKSTADQANS